MLKAIQLTQGKITWVDDFDFDYLSQWKWYAKKSGCYYYAVRTEKKYGPKIRMHRLLMSCPPDKVVHHVDGDTLLNARWNLEPMTQQQNLKEKRKKK